MTRVREMRALKSSLAAVSVEAGAGIDVFLGDAHFIDANTIEVDGQLLRFQKSSNCFGQRICYS